MPEESSPLEKLILSLPENVRDNARKGLVGMDTQARSAIVSTYLTAQRELAAEIKRAEHMKELAYHDTLTGLPNRRALDEYCERAFFHAYRTDGDASIIVIDIDWFKDFNYPDRDYGDKTLIKTARTLSDGLNRRVRSDEFLARWGGEEFVCVLADTNIEEANLAARRLQIYTRDALQDVRTLRHSKVQHPERSLTASFGVASLRGDYDFFEESDAWKSRRGAEGWKPGWKDVWLLADTRNNMSKAAGRDLVTYRGFNQDLIVRA
jgi:diguanylate cyclase (GGDEF)-like protein